MAQWSLLGQLVINQWYPGCLNWLLWRLNILSLSVVLQLHWKQFKWCEKLEELIWAIFFDKYAFCLKCNVVILILYVTGNLANFIEVFKRDLSEITSEKCERNNLDHLWTMITNHWLVLCALCCCCLLQQMLVVIQRTAFYYCRSIRAEASSEPLDDEEFIS